MKNFGDVFQLSQGSEEPEGAERLAAHFMYKSREGQARTRALRRSAAALT